MSDGGAKGRELGIEATTSVNEIGRYEMALERHGHEGW